MPTRSRSPLALQTLLVAAALAATLAPVAALTGADATPAGTRSPSAAPSAIHAGGFSDTHVFPGDYNTSGHFSQTLERGPHGISARETVFLASEVDGASIQLLLHRPLGMNGTRAPVILLATPYYTSGPAQGLTMGGRYDTLVENYVPHGYAVALAAVRGSGESGGCSDLGGPLERADLDQAITWLGTRDWSNGNVGMTGLSYDGSTTWAAASMGNPHLRTIVPVSGFPDQYSLLYSNGTPENRALGIHPTGYWPFGLLDAHRASLRDPTRPLGLAACPAVVAGTAASATASLGFGRSEFFAQRDQRPGTEASFAGSVFVVHGLKDWNVDPLAVYPWINDLETRGVVVKHLLGQWDHLLPDRAGARMDYAEILLRWFDYWLKEDVTRDLGPRAQVQDSSGRWRSEAAWPPRDTRPLVLHLTSDGKLATSPGDAEERRLVTFAPRVVACSTCATFRSDAQPRELRFAGIPELDLTVTPQGPGGAVFAELYLLRGALKTMVGHGSIDLRFAHGDETPREVRPGEPLDVRMWLQPLDVVVPAGAALQLEISQGPWTDPTDRLPTSASAPSELHVGGTTSVLTLRTFERDGSVFFHPPKR
ncbi:MAG TPA: CocE/NonD family hydrolase [Candidatus Thermoplasmatota archaeon]|nr:CocE/NonD family hydrolase [Candidatus Thermoplasmatota archaeon]